MTQEEVTNAWECLSSTTKQLVTEVRGLPPSAIFAWQDKPMPAIMARIIADTYRQMAEDMDAFAELQTKRELDLEII